MLLGFCLALVLLQTACTSSSPNARSLAGPPVIAGDAIIVGSFNFPESVLLAYLYAKTLDAQGLPAQVLPNIGNRELVEPALMTGLIHVLPEYAGSALDFLSPDEAASNSDPQATFERLDRAARQRGLQVAQPAAAQNSNAIVVTAATAHRHGLRSMQDLVAVAPQLDFGGPPECLQRTYCLPGLERTYGLRFKSFVPTDAGGPLTRQALVAGQIDVGLLFSTDPGITADNLVILADDRGLQPAENITPLVNRQAVSRYGPRLLKALDAVSSRLSTQALRSLNGRLEQGLAVQAVAEDWLRSQGLVPGDQGVQERGVQ